MTSSAETREPVRMYGFLLIGSVSVPRPLPIPGGSSWSMARWSCIHGLGDRRRYCSKPATIQRKLAVEQRHGTASYGDDRVKTTPPQGGTGTALINEVWGWLIDCRLGCPTP